MLANKKGSGQIITHNRYEDADMGALKGIVRNKHIRGSFKVCPIELKLSEACLKW